MKRLCRLILLGTLACIFAVFAVSCEEASSDDHDDDQSAKAHELAGEYEIDITDLGMPLVFYLQIDTEGNFVLSSNRDYDDDKGSGTVGQNDDTYMLVYSDSTTDEPKTATFTVENDNLHFSTSLPYGSANITNMREDEDDPDTVYYLVAHRFVYEDYHGQYAGGHTVDAMGTEIEYEYTMTLNPGKRYDFLSVFEMDGTVYEFTEEGTYSIEDDAITIVPEGQDEEVVGTIDPDEGLTIAIQPSEMGSREERNLRVTTTGEYAGTYYGYSAKAMGDMVVYDTEATLVLDAFGGYHYTGVDALSGEVEETGTYSVEGTRITYTPDGEEGALEGTFENLTITADFYKSAAGGPRGEIVLYSDTIQGEFTGSTTVEDVEYDAVLDLASDGTFTLVISDAEDEILDTSGDFSVENTMMLMVVLDSPEGTFDTVVSTIGLNASIDYQGIEYDFELRK